MSTVTVAPEALMVALSGRKFEAIKMVREANDAGLRDCKVAIETAMLPFLPTFAQNMLSGQQSVIRDLQDRLLLEQQDCNRLAAEVRTLRCRLAQIEDMAGAR